jgi:hypothetical protein
MTKNLLSRLSLLFLFFLSEKYVAQESHFGGFYQYGATLNFDKSNNKTFRPQDGSSAGIFYQLENGEKALGFRASLSARWNDIRWNVDEQVYILNKSRSVELKLQCTLRLDQKNSIGLGMAPRIVTHSGFALGAESSANGTTYDHNQEIQGLSSNLNELNSALCLSWYHDFNRIVAFGLHADADMLPFFEEQVAIPLDALGNKRSVNVHLASLSLSLIIRVR